MKKTLNKTLWISIISSLIFVIMGFIMVLNPETSLSIISYFVSAILVINGIYQMITEYKRIFNMSLFDGFTGGILSLMLGIFILLRPIALSLLISIALGIWMIITSSYKFRISMILKQLEESIWLVTLVLSVITMLCGILLLLNPVGGLLAITQVIGILIIVYSVIDIIEAFIFKRNMSKIVSYFERP